MSFKTTSTETFYPVARCYPIEPRHSPGFLLAVCHILMPRLLNDGLSKIETRKQCSNSLLKSQNSQTAVGSKRGSLYHSTFSWQIRFPGAANLAIRSSRFNICVFCTEKRELTLSHEVWHFWGKDQLQSGGTWLQQMFHPCSYPEKRFPKTLVRFDFPSSEICLGSSSIQDTEETHRGLAHTRQRGQKEESSYGMGKGADGSREGGES